MRKILKKFIHWIVKDDDDRHGLKAEVVASVSGRHRELLRPNGVQFTVYAAEGGTVIETTMYDNKTDESKHKLYIVPENGNFGEQLEQIVTMERLRRWH